MKQRLNMFRNKKNSPGSIWKSVAWELGIWLACFYALYFSYRYAFTKDMQTWVLFFTSDKNVLLIKLLITSRVLEKVSIHTDERMKYLPLTFMLGFFVTTVFERWRSALNVMPFIESVALSTAVLIPGKTEEDRLSRRAIVRYVVLHQVGTLSELFWTELLRSWCSVTSQCESVVASPLFNTL